MADKTSNQNPLVRKIVIYPGKGDCPYPEGTKVLFHVKAEALSLETIPPGLPDIKNDPSFKGKVIDDSHEWKQPVELLFGKKFKMEVWEECVNSMRRGEVSVFIIDKQLVDSYPIVSKTLRKAFSREEIKDKEEGHHCCGMGMKDGLGHADLDELVKDPKHMKFTLELLTVELPGSYDKQYWEMSESERVDSIPQLKKEGNELYKKGDIDEAAKKYSEAIGRLENLMLKEKPNDEEWNELNVQKLPLLLNFSQCKILQKEYYSAIEHCTTVLEHEKDNVKALYRRGRAYALLCEGDNARADLSRCCELDPSTGPGAEKILSVLALKEKDLNKKDKEAYAKLFESA